MARQGIRSRPTCLEACRSYCGFPFDKLLLLNDNSLPMTLEKGGYRAPLWVGIHPQQVLRLDVKRLTYSGR